MIELKAIKKTYAKQGTHDFSLSDINLSIPRGTVFGIIGRSGAGKTTLLNIMTKHLEPDAGHYRFEGISVDTMSRQAFFRRIGIVYQGYPLLMQKNVFDNVALPLVIRHDDPVTVRHTVERLLDDIGIMDLKDHYPSQLSGGQKQRVAIARALAGDPDVLFLDEPTSALDSFTTMELVALLKKIHRKNRLTLIIISHDLNVIDALCDRTALIEDGRITTCDETHAVTRKIKRSFSKEVGNDGVC